MGADGEGICGQVFVLDDVQHGVRGGGGVRGMGLMLGLALLRPVAKQVLTHCLENGLIVNAVGDDTIRLLPPLIITNGDADAAVTILGKAIAATA